MELTHIKARNFQSFKELHYEFRNGFPVLITGENLTDDGQESNGSGKSVLMTGPEFCILHTTSKKVNDKDLVYWYEGADTAEIELGIWCPVRKETMLIERRLSLKQGGSAQLSVNGVVRYAFGDKMVDAIDKYIIEWIGISKEDLQNFFILSKFKYTSFFAASNTALIQLIGRFSNSSIIAGIDKDVLAEADSMTETKSALDDQRNRLYGMIDVHRANVQAELTADRDKLVEEKLAEIDAKIIDLGQQAIHCHTQIGLENDVLMAAREKIVEHVEKMGTVGLQLRKLDKEAPRFDAEYAKVDLRLAEARAKKDKEEERLKGLSESNHEVLLTLQDIDRNLKGSTKCPACGHEFVIGREDVDVEEERQALEQANSLLSTLGKSIEKAREDLAAFQPELRGLNADRMRLEAEENEMRSLKRSIQASIDAIDRDKHALDATILTIEGRIAGHRATIEQCEARARSLADSKAGVTADSFDNTAKVKAIEGEIRKCEKELVQVDKSVAEIDDKIFEVKQWAFAFKEFQQYLSVKALKVLQGYANKFLSDIRSDLRVVLEGFKIKADGNLSDKITAYIIRNGEQKEFGNFSGGERVRLEAAMILTIQNAINSTNRFGGLNYLSIDEIFESADRLGISTLTSSLSRLGRTILLTTHIPGSNYECDTIKIVKVDNTSHIFNER